MLFLIPPAESKSAIDSGVDFSLEQLSFPEITSARKIVMEQLQIVSQGADAAQLLEVGPKAAAEIEANLHLTHAKAAPAAQVWDGVLANAAQIANLPVDCLEKVWIFSALFGVVNANDYIPVHRLAMKVKLGTLGAITNYWKTVLGPVLDKQFNATSFAGEIFIDCRSSDYRKVWQPPANLLTVLVEAKRRKGNVEKVVSHNAKRARGALVGALLRYLSANKINGCSSNTLEFIETALTDIKGKVVGIDDYYLEKTTDKRQEFKLTLIEEQ